VELENERQLEWSWRTRDSSSGVGGETVRVELEERQFEWSWRRRDSSSGVGEGETVRVELDDERQFE
jgi:hypothetical protein